MRVPRVLAVAILLLIASFASAQCAPPSWRSMGQRPELHDPVVAKVAALWDPDGSGPAPTRLAFGDEGAGGWAQGVATWDGSVWETIPTDWPITALIVWNGNLVAARDQTTYASPPMADVVRYDGTAWVQLGGAFDGLVYSLAVYNGDLIAAGYFGNAGGTAAAHIARWDGASWQPLGSGMPNGIVTGVFAMTVLNGELVAGGNFTVAGGVSVGSIARWNGTAWQALGADAGTWGIKSLAIYNGALIAAGPAFQHAGANIALNIARWDGTQWQPLGSGMSGTVGSMVLFNGDLVVTAGGTTQRWNGASWSPVGSNTSGVLAVYGGDLIAACAAPTGIVRWDGTGWQPLGAVFDHQVICLASFGDDVVAGGSFSSANGGAGSRIARWNGAAWQAMGAGFSGLVESLIVFNGTLLAGGPLTSSGGSPIGDVARWNGSSWLPFTTGLASGGTRVLAAYNGELIAAGQFSTAGGSIVNSIARWDGSAWHPLGSGFTLDWNGSPGTLYALTIFNGDLIAGGYFTLADGIPANGIARWDGSAWHPLGSGLSWGGGPVQVHALEVVNGDLVVGGDFDSAGAAAANNVARWDGSAWHAYGTGIDGPGNFTVSAIASLGSELFVGGNLWVAGGLGANLVAQWTGSSWLPMGQGIGGNRVNSMIAHHGAIIAGGDFGHAGGISSPCLARWSTPLPFLSVSQPGGACAGVEVRNAWLVPGHVYYNLASVDLAPGALGTGPYGGLWFSDVSVLVTQLQMPLGAEPFHVQAPGSSAAWGPYSVPLGVTFEAISVDVTGMQLGCVGSTIRYTTY